MAAAVTHVGETVLFGLVFALVGWAQMLTALWLSAGRGRAARTVMSVTNVAALAGWVLSRTVGLLHHLPPEAGPGVEKHSDLGIALDGADAPQEAVRRSA